MRPCRSGGNSPDAAAYRGLPEAGVSRRCSTNFDGALEKVSLDLTHCDSLGYTPPNPEDLRYRRIPVKLKVKGRGFEVRHRKGYQMRRPRDRMEGTEPPNVAYKLPVPVGAAGFKIAVGAKDALSRVTSFAVLRVEG